MTSGIPSKQQRNIILIIISSLAIYSILRIFTFGGIETGIEDWAVDMGYTQLFWGAILLFYCLVLLFYFKQKSIRFSEVDKFVLLMLSTPMFFVMGFILAGSQFVFHDPVINIYHSSNMEHSIDKLLHFITGFILIIIGLKIVPTRFMFVFLIILMLSYEALEIMWIWNLGGEAQMSLSSELDDIIPDMVANVLGIAVGYYYAVKYMKIKVKG